MKRLPYWIAFAVILLMGVCLPNGRSFAADGEEEAYKLKPKYMLNNSNFEMISATVTEDANNFMTVGNFRTDKDFDLMYWESEDKHSHPDLRYPTNGDFSGVVLDYNYTLSGDISLMNADTAPTMTIVTSQEQYYYIRLWNYVTDRPKDNWETEIGNDLDIDYVFPVGRVPGSANGTQGKITIDFDHLYAGWGPFVHSDPEDDSSPWVPNPAWVHVPVDDIKRIEWAFVPQEYDYDVEEMSYLPESKPFKIQFSNWNVYGNRFLMNEKPYVPVKSVRISDGYDDSYNLTPERIVGDYARLGFGGIVDFYVGASHYYDKQYTPPNGMELIQQHSFNQAFESWYGSYLSLLSARSTNVIASISMENVDAPSSWWQRTWDGNAATTYWNPAPKLLSFTNPQVQTYYNQLVVRLAGLAQANNLSPIIQFGEPWWWYMDSLPGSPPTFYDQATRELYQQTFGSPMYEFHSVNDPITGHEAMLDWLSEQNGNFALMLRNTLKSAYPTGQFTVLLFIPTVVDLDYAPKMMNIANFPIEQWKSPNLDFFMIEDYDYLSRTIWKNTGRR